MLETSIPVSLSDLICERLRLTPPNYHKICMKSFESIEICQLVKSSLIITPALGTQHKSGNLLFLESAHLMTRCRCESETKRDILCIKSESGAKIFFRWHKRTLLKNSQSLCRVCEKHSYWEKFITGIKRNVCSSIINFLGLAEIMLEKLLIG